MYVVSHPAPNEGWDMVRTDGARRGVVPGDSRLDARLTVGHVATDEPMAVAFAGGHRGAQNDARARLLEASDQLTPELRHDVLPRESKHAGHLGEIDLAYVAKKQALALDHKFHGDALRFDDFAQLEEAVGGALRIPLSKSAHASSCLGKPACVVGCLARGVVARVVDRFVHYERFWTEPSSASMLGTMGRPRTFDMDEALTAVREEFWRHGYAATSVDKLLEVTKLGKGSLYAAFGDKRTLFLRVLNEYAAARVAGRRPERC